AGATVVEQHDLRGGSSRRWHSRCRGERPGPGFLDAFYDRLVVCERGDKYPGGVDVRKQRGGCFGQWPHDDDGEWPDLFDQPCRRRLFAQYERREHLRD